MPMQLITPPAGEPISLAEAKLHLRVDFDDDDTLIQVMISAARQAAETLTNRQLVTARWRMVLDSFPGPSLMGVPAGQTFTLPGHAVLLAKSPVASVVEIRYLDMAGIWQVMPAANYTVDNACEPARITPVFGQIWPIDSTGFALVNHNHDTAYAALGHNHNTAYLGITAKAADTSKFNGMDSTAFVRSVNGVGPDVNGNSAIPIDLSSRVAKSGDTMSGTLTVPRLQIASTANYIDMVDQDWGTRYLHHNQGLMGFLKSDGSWDMYMNNAGSLWTSNYGWLQDYFFNVVSNCVRVNNNPSAGWQGAPNCQITDNCYNCGDQPPTAYYNLVTLFDQGGTMRLGAYGTRFNCNCNCDCC